MIRQFKIENFKSLQDVRLKLHSFTVLLGPNGAGKTGILQAISCLNGLMSNNFDHWLEERGTRYDDLPSLGGANKRILWQVEVGLGGRQGHQSVLRYTVSVRAWRYVGVETEEVHVVADGQPEVPLLIRKGRTVQVRDERTGQLSEPREVFAQVSSILTTLDYQRDAALYPSLLALRQFCEGIEVHKVFDVEGMRFARQKSEDVLSPSADNLQGYLAWLKAKDQPGFDRAVAMMKRLFPQVQEIELRTGPWGGRMTQFVERIARTGEPLSFRGSQASDGFLRLLALAALTQRTEPPTLLGLEEIENGVHLSLVATQLRLLTGLASSKAPCQVLVTTHNSFLLDFVKPEHVRVVLRERGRTRVSEIPPNNPYLATGTLHPGELWEFKEEKGLLATPRTTRGG